MNNEQYLNEVREVFKNDTTLFGKVWRHNNEGKSPAEIAKELRHTNSKTVNSRLKFIQYIERDVTPASLPAASLHRDRLRRFIKRDQDGHLSKNTIQELERRAEKCDHLADKLQAVQQNTKSKKGTKQAEKAFEPDIAGIYVYTYPHYYHHPDVPETNDTDARIRLKIGMSKRGTFKRVMQQTTGMPEPPMLLQIWKVEDDGDLREIEKKLHDYLRKAGHGDPSNEGREWFLTNEQFVASTANLLGLKLHCERPLEAD